MRATFWAPQARWLMLTIARPGGAAQAFGEAVAEEADRERQDGVAGRERVDDRGLEAAGAARGQDQHVLFGAEAALERVGDLADDPGELRPAVVDHLVLHRRQDGVGDGRRPGYTEVHGNPRCGCRASAPGDSSSPWRPAVAAPRPA